MLTTNKRICIITHEEGKLSIRRVKLDSVRPYGESYRVKASNLKGKYQKSYTLPSEPITDIRDPSLINCVNWVEDALTGEIDP